MNQSLTVGRTFLTKYQTSSANTLGHIQGQGIAWLSSSELMQEIVSRLIFLDQLEGEHKTVAILGETSLEWHLCDLALLISGRVVTPLYPTLSSEELAYIVKDSGASLVLVENQKLYERIAPSLGTNVQVVSFKEKIENVESCFDLRCNVNPGDCHSWLSERTGKVEASDLATIVYTSGTTGKPKGAMITHEALITMLSNVQSVFKGMITAEDANLVFLPLSHVLGRCDSFLHLSFPVKTIFSRGFSYLAKDLLLAKPSILISVPRVFEKIYEGILLKKKSMPLLKKGAFELAEKISKTFFLAQHQDEAPSLATNLLRELSYKVVYKNIVEQMGGRIRFFVSGGAPLNSEIYYFFERAGLTILEGYGLTETIAPCCLNPIRKPIVGTVGIPMGDVKVRLEADGEIAISSKALFSGYWNMPEESEKAFKDGWFLTGDIGQWSSEGHLKITDRKKDLIITSGGKNVAPQKIENLLLASPYISQAIVVGDRQKYLAALLVLNFETLRKLSENLDLPAGLPAPELIKQEGVVKMAQEIVDQVNKELSHYETIKRFTLLSSEFTVENGLLTPSLKPKRRAVERAYQTAIDAMY